MKLTDLEQAMLGGEFGEVRRRAIAQGAAFAGFPLIDRFETDITEAIRTDDEVSVDPASGLVTVRRQDR